MSNKKLLLATFSWLSLLAVTNQSLTVEAETTGFDTNGKVKVQASDTTKPLDPENPLTPVDPGESPSTEGELRIDFVSAINFADTTITKSDRKYPSLAQLFHTETPARASYVQVTDLREGSPGWNLQLKQETQFKNGDNIELSGATLSFDKGWANSGGLGTAPAMFRDTISIDEIGNNYQVASAAKGAGQGTWLLSFGASSDNQLGQENSLTLLKDASGKTVLDSTFNKELYTNSAINLTIPDKTSIIPGRYQTELTWSLQATP